MSMCWSCKSSMVHLIYWCSKVISQLSRHTVAWLELVRNNASCVEVIGKCERYSHSTQDKFLNGKNISEAYGNPNYTKTGCESLSLYNTVQLELGKGQGYDLQSSSVLRPALSDSHLGYQLIYTWQ